MLRVKHRLVRFAGVVFMTGFVVFLYAMPARSSEQITAGSIVFSGKDVFRGFFFGDGPAATRLRGLRTLAMNLAAQQNEALRSRSESVVKEEGVQTAIQLQRHQVVGRMGGSIGAPPSQAATSAAETKESLLAQIESQDPTFFDRFGRAMQLNGETQAGEAIGEGGSKLLGALAAFGFAPSPSSEAPSGGSYATAWRALSLALPNDTESNSCIPCSGGCLYSGALTGGEVVASKPRPSYGDIVNFAATGTKDSGGGKIVCDGKAPRYEPIPPALPQYSWDLQSPQGDHTQGSGPTTDPIAINRCGTWTATFYANAPRECPPDGLYVGAASVTCVGDVPCPAGAPLASEVVAILDGAAPWLAAKYGNAMVDKMRAALNARGVTCRCGTVCANEDPPHVDVFFLNVNRDNVLVSNAPVDAYNCRRGNGSAATNLFHELLHIGFGNANEGPVCDAFTNCPYLELLVGTYYNSHENRIYSNDNSCP